METLPFFQRKVVAVWGPCSASPPAKWPFLRNPSSWVKHSSTIVFRSVSDMFSNLFGSMYPRQMYFIILVLFVVLRVFILTVSEDSRLGFPEFDNTSHFFKKLFLSPPPPNSRSRFSRNRRSGSNCVSARARS